MDTYTIRRTLQKIAHKYKTKNKKTLYYQVCACDLLPISIPKNQDAVLIINLDKSDSSGSHWVCVHISKRVCHYFDSYGLYPTNSFIKKFIKNNSNTLHWNHQRLQSYFSYYCGQWACMFAHSITNNALSCFFSKFSRNVHSNDEIVRSLYACTFNNKPSTQHCKSYFNCIQKT